MKTATKVWLIIAASLVISGGLIFAAGLSMHGWDFTKLSTTDTVTNEHSIEDSFESIRIITNTADIEFLPSEDGTSKVVLQEREDLFHTVKVTEGKLSITITDTRKWYEHIELGSFYDPKITVTLPEGQYRTLFIENDTGDIDIPAFLSFDTMDISDDTGDVNVFASAFDSVEIENDTGDIYLKDTSAKLITLETTTGDIILKDVSCDGELSLEVTTGQVMLTTVRCGLLSSEGDTGDITLKDVIAENTMSIERSTGYVIFDGSDAKELFIETDTGDVRGTLLSEKIFFAESDTGRIRVPKSVTGGKCEITTDTGNILIDIKE